jgi:hypothetical protein
MATPIGTNVVTSLARRYILPEIVDTIYDSNPIFYRMNAANKRIIRGGTQIEVPFMYKRFSAGGPYQGYDVLTVTPSDTVKNGAWDWKQHYVPVVVDGLTLIKTDSAEAIANFIQMYFQQAEEEMAENLGAGLWSDGVTNTKDIDGIEGAVDAGGVLTTYGGLTRASNTWLNAKVDSSTSALTLATMQTLFGRTSSGGRHPTIIASRQEQYNRYWALAQADQTFDTGVGGHDEQLASAGFTNLLFNNVPWVVDSHVPDGHVELRHLLLERGLHVPRRESPCGLLLGGLPEAGRSGCDGGEAPVGRELRPPQPPASGQDDERVQLTDT